MKARARRKNIHQSALPAKGMLLLNLSLFIMLLAFFIVMNAISSWDKKRYQPILKSLDLTFSISALRDGTKPSMIGAEDHATGEGDTVERIDALFNAQITGFKATKSSVNGTMHAEIPLDEFDRAMRAANQVDLTKVKSVTGLQTYFLPTLVSLMQAEAKEQPYRLDIIMHTKDEPPLLINSDPRQLNEAIKNISAYADLLEEAGMKPQLISVGLQKGETDRVDLYFRPQFMPVPAVQGAP